MFAVIRTGGKQYHVKPGDVVKVEKLEGQVGDQITPETLYTSADGKISLEKNNNAVSAEIIGQDRLDKIIVFKKKRRQNYRRLNGHRQHTTVLRILSVGGKTAAAE